MENSYAEFDRDNYPLIKIVFTGAEANESNFHDYLTELLKNYQKREKIAILFDAAKAKFPPLKYQILQAQWMKDHEKLMKDYCTGIAYTIPGKVIRSALKLIFKLQKQPVPFKVFSDNDNALKWLKSGLESSNRS